MWKYGFTDESLEYDIKRNSSMWWRYEYASIDCSLNTVINLAVL